MEKNRSLISFHDILEPRRREFSNFQWVSRKLNTVLAYKQNVRPTPESHKQQVIDNQRIQNLIQKVSDDNDLPRSAVEHNVRLILDEIGFNKQLKVIRWLGLTLTKICQKVYAGIHVNEQSVKHLKSVMGDCPVLFVPSHRSYADFILMSYICFTYDIEIPAIAAGMDFHGMWGMGAMLRDTGAFFMRRSYNDDELYWETFKQYVHQLVTKGDLPIEFFIEGTRSRSCKSLCPKYGLLSMMLKPFFTAEVPDILIVPINISYDRVLEEKLFAYELLGVPKPKESTSGFFKSLSIIKENFGNIYVDFAEPISAKEYFGIKTERLHHILKPIHSQTLNQEEKNMISNIAYDIVYIQQKHCVITTFNLISVLLNNNIMLKSPPSLQQLTEELKWLRFVMETLGALVSDEETSLMETLAVHTNFIHVDESSKVNLINTPVIIDNIDPAKLKGHALTNKTMTKIIPEIMLQLYVNPCLHYLINHCFIVVAMLTFAENNEITKDELFGHFQFLRSLYCYEFVFHKKREQMEFEEALNHLAILNGITVNPSGKYLISNNSKLHLLLSNLINPFVSAYLSVCYTLANVSSSLKHKDVLLETQKMLEKSLMGGFTMLHPYSLSLDTLSICLQSFTNMGVINKMTKNENVFYEVIKNQLSSVGAILERIFSKCYGKFRKVTFCERSSNISKL